MNFTLRALPIVKRDACVCVCVCEGILRLSRAGCVKPEGVFFVSEAGFDIGFDGRGRGGGGRGLCH